MGRYILVAISLAALASCGSSGPEVETSEMGLQAFAVVEASGEVSVAVTMTTADPDSFEVNVISLEEGDSLTAQLDGVEIELVEEAAGQSTTRYAGSFTAANPSELIVSLHRASGTDAPDSRVVLPSGYSIVDPPASVTRGDTLDLTWSASGEVGTSRVLVSGPCVVGIEARIDDDPGEAALAPTTFEAPDDIDPSAPCSARVQIDRIADGMLDSTFGRGGRIEATQMRFFNIDVVAP